METNDWKQYHQPEDHQDSEDHSGWPIDYPSDQWLEESEIRGKVPPQIASVSVTNAERGKATLLDFIHPELKARAAEWIEYKTPEGKCYYFCPKDSTFSLGKA